MHIKPTSGFAHRAGRIDRLTQLSTSHPSIMSIANKLSITDLDLKSKRVLIRVDFNVPMADGKVTNPAVRTSSRLHAICPTH